MRRITLWILSTISALVLLFSYHTSTTSTTTTPAAVSLAVPPAATTIESESGASDSSSGTSPLATSSADPPMASGQDQTFTGSAVNTRFGPVQVQITVAGSVITDATVTEVPNSNGKDRQINARAVPILEDETTAAQSSAIDMVSGATYTSEGYIESLQSALDQANLS